MDRDRMHMGGRGMYPCYVWSGFYAEGAVRSPSIHPSCSSSPFPFPFHSPRPCEPGLPYFIGTPPSVLLRFLSMGSSPRLLGRQRPVHEILGGGLVADVVLWRRSNVTISILLGTLGARLLFLVSRYTLLSLVSSVLLLLLSILFVWAKAATVLNRPLPPIPKLQLSEELADEAKVFVHSHVNRILSGFQDIALGKDSTLFYKVAASLWLISIASSWTDFLTFGYICLVVVLTLPVAYEKFEDYVDRFFMLACAELTHHGRLYAEYLSDIKNWIMEKKKKFN